MEWGRDPLTGPLLRMCQCKAGEEGILTLLSTAMLTLNAALPIMYATLLLNDPSYVFWHGTYLPMWILGLCIFTVVLYIASLNVFWNTARDAVKTDSTMILVASTFSAMLGLGMVYCALPLWRETALVAGQIRGSCNFNLEAERLVNYEQVLHQIRAQPQCASKPSVEDCEGYSENDYTRYLKYLESEFGCSGLCPVTLARFAVADPAANGTAAATAPTADAPMAIGAAAPPAALLLATKKPMRPRRATVQVNRKSLRNLQAASHHHDQLLAPEKPEPHEHASTAVALLDADHVVGAHHRRQHQHHRRRQQPGGALGPPPLIPGLFSKNAHRWGCSDFVGGQLVNVGGGAGGQIFWQGLALLGVGVVVGLLKLVNMCVFDEDDDAMHNGHDLHYYAQQQKQQQQQPPQPNFQRTGAPPQDAVPTVPQQARRIN